MEQATRLVRKLETATRQFSGRRAQSKLAVDTGLSVSSILPSFQGSREDKEGQCGSHVGDTLVAESAVVSTNAGTNVRQASNFTAGQAFACRPESLATSTAGTKVISTSRIAVARDRLAKENIPSNVSNLLLDGNRKNTHKAYDSAFQTSTVATWVNHSTVEVWIQAALCRLLIFVLRHAGRGSEYTTLFQSMATEVCRPP